MKSEPEEYWPLSSLSFYLWFLFPLCKTLHKFLCKCTISTFSYYCEKVGLSMRQVLNKYKLFLWTIKIPILLYAYPYNVKYILKMQNILDIILFEAYAEIRRRGKPPSSFNFILSFLPKERRISMKQFFDERQTQTAEHLGTISFYVIFLVSITAILIQLTFFSAPLQNVLGETAAVLTGGLVYLSGCIKNGLWSSDKTKSSWRENLILSLVCSGIFSIFMDLP